MRYLFQGMLLTLGLSMIGIILTGFVVLFIENPIFIGVVILFLLISAIMGSLIKRSEDKCE